jgi:hypothetical protein
MQELEKKAYIYSVEAIGFGKSMEKTNNEKEQINEFKIKSGELYKLIAETHKTEGNEEFADLLRNAKQLAPELNEMLSVIKVEDTAFAKQKEQLTQYLSQIEKKLDEILSKIIY